MDSTLYEDHVGRVAASLQPQKSTSDVRAQLSLDFKTACQRRSASGLSNLAIDSPDFEKFIASQSDILSSSTPTTQILFPKLVTEVRDNANFTCHFVECGQFCMPFVVLLLSRCRPK